jgi:hypothetical protein
MTFKNLYQKITNTFGHNSNQMATETSMTKNNDKRKTVDFQGAIDIVTIEGVFQLLYFASLTGKLILLNPPDKATFHFVKGQLTWGSLHANQKQIGQRLLDSEFITEEQLNECLTIHMNENNKKRLGEILLEKGFLQSDLLHDSLKKQAKEAFFSVLSWKGGTFAFISNFTSNEDEVSISERIDHLLLEGAVQIDRNSESVPTTLSDEPTYNYFKVEHSEQ